ncbi:type II toxin-antitoxin system RelE/ParE family toxin [Chlamydiota bacterium]
MEFIESPMFTKEVYKYLSEEEYSDLQLELVKNPQLGDVIPGCGGIRKVRWGSRSKGKRGGIRTLYLYIDIVGHMHLLGIFGKNVKEDLNSGEKKKLKELAQKLKNISRKYFNR